MNQGRLKSFLLGSVFGGLVSLFLLPRGRRRTEAVGGRMIARRHPFSSAPCYRPDDDFT